MNLILLNEPLSGSEAYQVGLVSKLVEPGMALSGALEIAENAGFLECPNLDGGKGGNMQRWESLLMCL